MPPSGRAGGSCGLFGRQVFIESVKEEDDQVSIESPFDANRVLVQPWGFVRGDPHPPIEVASAQHGVANHEVVRAERVAVFDEQDLPMPAALHVD